MHFHELMQCWNSICMTVLLLWYGFRFKHYFSRCKIDSRLHLTKCLPGISFHVVVEIIASIALTLLVGHPACDEVLAACHMTGWKCKWMCNPDDAIVCTVTLSSCASLKSRMGYLSGAGLLRLSWRGSLNVCVISLKHRSVLYSHTWIVKPLSR